jgi:hypothetical protein
MNNRSVVSAAAIGVIPLPFWHCCSTYFATLTRRLENIARLVFLVLYFGRSIHPPQGPESMSS